MNFILTKRLLNWKWTGPGDALKIRDYDIGKGACRSVFYRVRISFYHSDGELQFNNIVPNELLNFLL